jgi:hypothetical protein
MEKYIRATAGLFIIISVLLAYFVNINWIWFTLFVGVNLLQYALTNWCLMEKILKKMGL